MDTFWQSYEFEVLMTEDGSPTLKSLKSAKLEAMHHWGGAFSETQLIYGEPLREALNLGGRKIMSLGLGLGYNEILIACECILRNLNPNQVFIQSFESEKILVELFSQFVWQSENRQGVHDKILDFYLEYYLKNGFKIDKTRILDWLSEAITTHHLEICPALTPKTEFNNKFNLVFYDAFSSKTSPELWDEQFLTSLWQKISDEFCIITSYACTGALKRSLKNSGFALYILEGFKNKSDRTLAKKLRHLL